MAKFDYAGMAKTATALLVKFGREDLILRSYSAAGSAWSPTRTSADTVVTGAVVSYDNRSVDGTLVLATDKRALISVGAGIEPTKEMKLVIDGVEHEIVNVTIYSPAGTPVAYDCQVRI